MINLQQPVTYLELGHIKADEFLNKVLKHCHAGAPMHPEALVAVVSRLTYLSRDMSIPQGDRDTAADLANSLANAAIASFGKDSEYSRKLVNSVKTILSQQVF